MKEISNKALTILLVVAIVISLGGTLTSLSRLARIDVLPVTGLVASNFSTGYVNLSVLSAVSFAVTGNIDFGSGYVNGSNIAVLESNVTSTLTNGTGSWVWSKQHFLLENDGSVDIMINISSDKNASNLTGGSSPEFAFALSEEESNACDGTATTAWTEFNTSDSIGMNQTVCSGFQFEDATDQINVSIRVAVPEDATKGGANSNITFIGQTKP